MTIRAQPWVPRVTLCVSLVLAALLAVGALADAQSDGPPSPLRIGSAEQSGGSYDLSWWSVDSGGCTARTGAGYALAGTIGQPDSDGLSGGGYTLGGGFWGSGVTVARDKIYLPLVLRDS